MLNRATNILNDDAFSDSESESSWHVDSNPATRLIWLFVLILLPLIVVSGRLIYVQTHLAAQIVALPEKTTISYERIPSRDGRILSSDGTILARDIELYKVQMHYRRLEEPADERWLRSQALSRLSRRERRDREKVETASSAVLDERNAMWSRLSQLTGVSLDALTAKQQRIQKRTERIIDNVERRQRQRQLEAREAKPPSSSDDESGAWETVWNTVVKTLTTSPSRSRFDPIEIPEEFDYHALIENVSFEVAAEIETHPERYPGLRIEASTRRIYPENSFAAHVIGVRLPIGDDQLKQRSDHFTEGDPLDYRSRDRIGKNGLERAYDRRLRGLPGLKRVVKNRRGEILRTEVVRHPRVGRDIVLTLHSPLQKQAEELLDHTIGTKSTAGADNSTGKATAGGCVVVMNVNNGELLAVVSAPGFDQNLMIHPDPVEWKQISEDPRRPFFHRAIKMTIAPGSVFKTLSAVALLESGMIDPDEPFFCQGFLDRPNRHRCYVYRHFGVGHGETDLSDALCRSCNVYFYNAARRMGPEPIVEWAQKFGFGQPTGIDLPGERGGNLPIPPALRPVIQLASAKEPQTRQSDPWYQGDTLGLAIGQSRLTVTPLQIVRMMAAIANGGELVTPHVADSSGPSMIGSDDLNRATHFESLHIPGLSEGTLPRIREGLRKVVHHPQGTGYKRVRLEEITIAGKTGTTEVGGGKVDHAWFAGYVPAENPRYAFVVVLEHAGSGGKAAGPVARQLVQLMLNLGLLEPTVEPTSN